MKENTSIEKTTTAASEPTDVSSVAASTTEEKLPRRSGVELLKILAILGIILNHVLDTLLTGSRYVDYTDYILSQPRYAQTLAQYGIQLLHCLGSFGVDVFFICSAWFLLGSDRASGKKIMLLITEVWTISVLCLAAVTLWMGQLLDVKYTIMSFFPIIYGTNWYITCYLLFYALHPYLNRILRHATQREHLKIAFALGALYILLPFVFGQQFFTSTLILWVAIYFVIGYVKLYLPKSCASKKANLALFLAAFLGHCLVIYGINTLGAQGVLTATWDRFNSYGNPFYILMAIALVNLAAHSSWHNLGINRVASLTLLIYLIHENIMVRSYVRPALLQWIYLHLGYERVALWVSLLVLLIFIVAAILGALYRLLLGSAVRLISEKIYGLISACYHRLETWIFSRH